MTDHRKNPFIADKPITKIQFEEAVQVSDGLFISIKMRQVFKTCRGMGTYSSDGKPGSVVDSHSSRHIIAGVLKQPTRTLGEQRHRVLFGLAPNGV